MKCRDVDASAEGRSDGSELVGEDARSIDSQAEAHAGESCVTMEDSGEFPELITWEPTPCDEAEILVAPVEATTSATLEWAMQDLKKSGLDWATAEAAGFRTISPVEATAIVGYGLPADIQAYAISFVDPATGGPMKCRDGARDFVRLRPRVPVKLRPDDERPAKYLSPVGAGNRAFIPKAVYEALQHGGPVVMTEGEKKALAATQSGIPTIGLVGVWGWTDGETHDLLPEIARHVGFGRNVTFVLDSDAAINAHIAHSACALNRSVHAKGGTLRVAVLPPAIGSDGRIEKNGMDDLLVREGPERLNAAVEGAQPISGNTGEVYVALASGFLSWCAEHGPAMDPVADEILRKGYWDGIDYADRRKLDVAMRERWPGMTERVRAGMAERLNREFASAPEPPQGGKQLRSGVYVTAPGQTAPLKVEGLDDDIAYCVLPGTSASRPYPRRLLEIATAPERPAQGGERRPSVCAADMADAFISRPEMMRDGVVLLRSYRDAFCAYRDGFYEEVPLGDVKAEVMGFIRRHPDFRERATKNTLTDILEHLRAEGVGRVPGGMARPLWIDGDLFRPATGWTAMKNCLVNVESLARAINGEDVSVGETTQDLTPKLFATVKMDYDFDQDATCPKFEQFLGQLLPDPELRESVQMMLGLLLVPDTSLNVAFFFLGTGGNGKSQLVNVVGRLVGAHNICHVPFAALEQKHLVGNLCRSLVNIIGDGDAAIPTDMSQQRFEGVFKNVTDGGLINLEPKFKDAQVQPATARFLMAMNSLPPFSDRTDGVWDRLRIIPFTAHFRNETGEILDLGAKIADEELPGIFNFAVTGLAKLRSLPRFPETAAGLAIKREHRTHCDHEREFLADEFQAASDSEPAIKSMEIYRQYSEWMKDRGYKPRGEAQFAAGVKRVFPGAEKAKQRFSDGSRGAAWSGIARSEVTA